MNPKDCKNLTFDALSFFLLTQLNERALSSGDVTSFVKNALSLCVRSAPFNTSISRSLSLSHVQSDGDLLSAKIEQSSVLVDDAYR